MGLLDMMLPGTNTTAWASPLGLPPVVQPNLFASWFDQNQQKIVGGLAGLAGASPNDPRGILNGIVGGVMQGGPADQAKQQAMQQQQVAAAQVAQQQAQQNRTIDWLKQNAPKYADAVANGAMSPADAWKAAMQPNARGITPSGYRWTPNGDTLEPIPGGPADPNSAQAISPEALDLIATQYLAGDKSAITGYARNANMRAQIANAVAAKANSVGMDGKAIAAEISAYGGNVAAQRAAGTRAAQVGMAASEASQMADIALQASASVPRGSLVPWNSMVNAMATGTSSPEMAAFVTATTSLVNAYARAVSPLGAPTDAMRQHAEQMLNTAQGPEAYAAVIAQMKKEMQAALNAPAEISGSLKTNITGLPPDVTGAGSSDAGTPPDGIDSMTWQYMTPDERALWQN